MAIQIASINVIDNSRNVVNVVNGNYSGIVTATKFVGNFQTPTGTAVVGFGTYVTLTSGTSWTVPAGVGLIKVYATGGGAGGTAQQSPGVYYGRGASGATAIRYYTVSPGTTATYSIGAGGLGNSSTSGYGASGGSTTFTYGGVTITGTGGSGVSTPPSISIGSNGQINLYGGFGSLSTGQFTTFGDAPQATGYGLGGTPSTTNNNGQQGAIVIEY